jgi:hypothetical protein
LLVLDRTRHISTTLLLPHWFVVSVSKQFTNSFCMPFRYCRIAVINQCCIQYSSA